MKKFVAPIKNIQFTDKSVPWILLAACILAFGLLIPKLGFFQDDWNFVFNSYAFGSKGIADFLRYDGRPFAAWVFDSGFALLGFKPIYWHIAELLIRWLTAYTLWLVFRTIWPNYKWQTLTASLLFVLYPFFTLQPLAVTYTLHWTGYLLYALSIYFMLRAQTKYFWLFTILALATQALHLFTLEFYSGIDLLRPVFLWLVLSKSNLSTREKLSTTLRKWAPYLIVFILYFIWRGFIYHSPVAGRNNPLLLAAFLSNPISTIANTLNNALPDIVLILITSWYSLIEPGYFDFSQSANLYIFILSAISFVLFYYSFQKEGFPEEKSDQSNAHFFIVGILALLLSLLPVYAAGYVIHAKIEPWNSRLSLGSLLGAALIITGLVGYLIKVPRTRWIILSIVLALMIGWHQHSTNDFRWAWDKQVNFYRQLYLRAPAIKPGTAILAEEEILGFMGDYPTSYGINSIYTSKGSSFEDSRNVDYWFFPLPSFSRKFKQYLGGEIFSAERAGINFQGEPEGSVVILFAPEQGQCLWIIRPEDVAVKTMPDTTRQLAQISYIDRIEQAPQNPDSFLFKYLYANPMHDWCYYYQKADLAYQYEEWDEVIQLWESAREARLLPASGFEYIPFIEAYGRAEDWETAKQMTLSSQKTMQGIEPLLCHIWTRLENDTPASAEKEAALFSVTEDLGCEQE